MLIFMIFIDIKEEMYFFSAEGFYFVEYLINLRFRFIHEVYDCTTPLGTHVSLENMI